VETHSGHQEKWKALRHDHAAEQRITGRRTEAREAGHPPIVQFGQSISRIRNVKRFDYADSLPTDALADSTTGVSAAGLP
jgi:hypothetical protein